MKSNLLNSQVEMFHVWHISSEDISNGYITFLDDSSLLSWGEKVDLEFYEYYIMSKYDNQEFDIGTHISKK